MTWVIGLINFMFHCNGSSILFVLAIAEVYKNQGNEEYRKKEFINAIHFYTEGIKVNCKDEDLNAKLYSNRAIANFKLGKNCLYFVRFSFHILSGSNIVSNFLIECIFSFGDLCPLAYLTLLVQGDVTVKSYRSISATLGH